MSQTINREYKSTVFAMLFSDKEKLKSLCEAVSGEKIDSAEDITINTLTDEDGVQSGIFTRLKNDVSFIFHGYQKLYEHQSTWSANMPVRMLLYYAELLRTEYPLVSLYRGTGISLDTPQFVMFYNGSDQRSVGDREILRLSNLYKHSYTSKEKSLELTVLVYNINEGHNPELMEACEIMKQYSEFVAMGSRALKGLRDKGAKVRAMETVLDQCLEQGILSEFIKENRRAIIMRSILEFDEEAYAEALRLDGYDDGARPLYALVQDGDVTLERAAEKAGITPEEFEQRMTAAGFGVPM